LANKVRQRWLEEWKREDLKRTPFALLDDPLDELRPVKKPRRKRSRTAPTSKHLSNHLITPGPPPWLLDPDQAPRKTLPSLDAGGLHLPRGTRVNVTPD